MEFIATETESGSRRSVVLGELPRTAAGWLTTVLLGAFAIVSAYLLCRCSVQLAATRMLQVDECQNVYVARIIGTGNAETAFTRISLFSAPLAVLARNATQSVELFASARGVSLILFWLNLMLIALGTGQRLLSVGGLLALAGACTLAPLWDYGFEVRHDNLLLTGLLLTWCALRIGRPGLHSYVVGGAIAIGLQFTAFKAFVYTVPLSVAFLCFPPSGDRLPRWKLALAWVAGAAGTFLVVRLAYGAAGIWDTYVRALQWATDASTGGGRFAPWSTLARLLTQTPLLLALLLAAVWVGFADFWRQGRATLSWDGYLPELGLFLVALVALLINPAPHPYNLVNLVPFAYILCFRFAAQFCREVWVVKSIRPLLVSILVFAHVVPFVISVQRHFGMLSLRQERVIQLAEALTDPRKDPVYDGVGLVPTRPSIGYHWLLHSLNIQSFKKEDGLRVRDLLASRPATVVIPNYRTDWLPGEDHEFIRAYYVPLADDFWVLGKLLPPGGGSFEILHPGRYQITAKDDSCIAGTGDTNQFTIGGMIKNAAKQNARGAARTNLVGRLDGVPLSGQAIELAVGTHRIETSAEVQPAVVWLGPQLKQLSPLPDSDHRRLFINWY